MNKSKNVTKEIQLAGVMRESVVDGPGWRFVIFSQGCPHKCKGCQNPETFSLDGGYTSKLKNLLSAIDENPMLSGVTFSGGDPFVQATSFATLGREIRNRNLDIVTFTGYTVEELLAGMDKNDGWRDLLEVTDILVDGPFVLEKKSLSTQFRGSTNQRVLDARESVKQGKAVETTFDSLSLIAKTYKKQ